MLNRLQATFTVYDCFDNNFGNFINFAAMLKIPPTLHAAWTKAISRSGAPVSWKEIKSLYQDTLNAIKDDDQVLMLEDEHVLDWTDKIFGSQPMHSGFSEEKYWEMLRAGGGAESAKLP